MCLLLGFGRGVRLAHPVADHSIGSLTLGDGEDDAGGRAYRHQGADDGDDDGGALVALRPIGL